MALRFNRKLRGSAVETPVKFQSHSLTLIIDLTASRLDEIWESQLVSWLSFSERHPCNREQQLMDTVTSWHNYNTLTIIINIHQNNSAITMATAVQQGKDIEMATQELL